MVDFFFSRKETQDERLAKEASGEMDLITSPRDGKLVAVCQENGVHVCGYCLQPFLTDPMSPLYGIEMVPPGPSQDGQNFGTRILIHAKCVDRVSRRGRNLLRDRERGHQIRRFLTKAFNPFGKKDA